MKQYTPKLDADDQEQLAQTPKWEKSPEEIAQTIANNFYTDIEFFHADLKWQIIIKVIEAEREVTSI